MNPASSLFCSSGALILLNFSCFFVFTLKECQASSSEKHVTGQKANVTWSLFFKEFEDCKQPSCSNGTIRKQKHGHSPSFNGCGAYDLKLEKNMLPAKEFENCCNLHDICYDTCNSLKSICDMKFKYCLYKVCKNKKDRRTEDDLKDCKYYGKLMYWATKLFGCNTYQESQKEACYCKLIVS